MKKETTILMAGSLGLFAVLGFLALKKFLNNKKYKLSYEDYHRHFESLQDDQTEDDGIEYYAMR